MSEHKGIGWMYDGVKADAHREDYLLGKTIDKNFEKYSDAVIVEKEEAVDALAKTRVVGTTSSSTSKMSSLPLNVMKSEDPLVAIKVKEESKRRDVLENPLTKLRFQKMMKEMMDKKVFQSCKKDKRKRRDHSSSDAHSSSDEKRKKKKKHKKERDESDDDRGRKEKKRKRLDSSPEGDHKTKDHRGDERRHGRRSEDGRDERWRREKSRERSEERRRRRDSSEKEIKKRKRRDSSGDGRGRRREWNGEEKRRRRDSHEESKRGGRDSSEEDRRVEKESRRRRDSSEENRNERKGEKDKRRGFDSHIPAHLRPGSSSEDEQQKDDYDKEEKASKAKWEGYGLVGGKKKEKSDEKEMKNPYELKRIPKFTVHEKSERKRPLTEEEKAAKLKEMEMNAKWRDDVRVSNEKRTRLEEEAEEKDDDGRPASFVKPLLNSVADELSMEDRLKQRKKQLQRGHGYMDKL
ncbi:hypothetical protein PMAYCL1PPCAC_12481 [Pristionchus mayeri]|uniref:Uncharacterized protein n=1 Tax=Pristionchus mayeri TaxID=1317129 RepID=A0AAN4ZK41_9BILA|nr:hypothetical protein PMAYCL1PPCAC_12481 [Pristionchus mayeri]